jgi:hypothetical protein
MIIQYDNASYPVRDKSSVEKGNHSPLPHAVRYATNESQCCIPTACCIVSEHVLLPIFNPYRDLKKNRHWMYFGLSHDNIERDNLNRRSAIAKCTPSYPVREKSSVEKGNHYPLPHAVRYATNESQCCIPTACYFVRERHCGLDPQSPNPKNNQEIAGQARNDEMRQFEVSTQLQSLSGFEKQP